MSIKRGRKVRIITLRDYQLGKKNIAGNIERVYLVIKLLESSIGEDAVHLHLDLKEDIDLNIFTEDFCDKLLLLLPEEMDVYYGADRRLKLLEIDKLEKKVANLLQEEKVKKSKLFNKLKYRKKINTEKDKSLQDVISQLKELVDAIIEGEQIGKFVASPKSYRFCIKNLDKYYFCIKEPQDYYSIEVLDKKPEEYIDIQKYLA